MKFLSYIVTLLIGFLSGVYFGFHKAPSEFYNWDAQHRASILAHEIKWLKAGKIDRVVESKEIELDASLANYGRHLNSSYRWITEYVAGTPEDSESISHAVRYRLENEYEGPDMSSPSSWKNGADMNSDFIQEVIDGQKENKILIKQVLDSYAPQ